MKSAKSETLVNRNNLLQMFQQKLMLNGGIIEVNSASEVNWLIMIINKRE